MTPKLIICIDGLGKDLVTKENTPFLHSFGKNNSFSELKTLFAFTGLEYCFFTGKNPSESKIWMEFIKSKDSIFDNWVLRRLSLNKKIRDYYGAFLQLMKKRTWISGLHNIPKNKLKYFDTSTKSGLWKLDFFQNKSFAFYKWPFFIVKERDKEKRKIIFNYEKDEERLLRLLSSKNKEVYYAQLMGIDKAIHNFGKKSEKSKEIIRKTDKIIEKYVGKFLDENKGGRIFLWSDHGFADIKKYINIMEILPRRKDYLFFIAGTTVHFWFKNNNSKKEVLKVLSKIKELKRLDEKTAEEYNIPLSKKYGDLIFYVEKGLYFFPNFYQKSEKEKFVAMHGYPDNKELSGVFITNIAKRKDKSLKINKIIQFLNE